MDFKDPSDLKNPTKMVSHEAARKKQTLQGHYC